MGNKISTRQDFKPHENIQNIERNKKFIQYAKNLNKN